MDPRAAARSVGSTPGTREGMRAARPRGLVGRRRRGSPARTSASTVAMRCAGVPTCRACWSTFSARTGSGAWSAPEPRAGPPARPPHPDSSVPVGRQVALERLGEPGERAEQLLGAERLAGVAHAPDDVALGVAGLHQHPDRQRLVALLERAAAPRGPVGGAAPRARAAGAG